MVLSTRLALAALVVHASAGAQNPPAPRPSDAAVAAPSEQPAGASASRVDGRIVRVTGADERPVRDQWVVLHGVGASGGRAIDSVRTGSSGAFRIRYSRSADNTTQYFVSTVHHGIAYVSGVLPPDATVDDATLTVFDTTSAPVRLTVRGRHILVFAPADGPRRRVAEIFDLSNDTTVTRVSSDAETPIWTGTIPTGFEEFSSGPELSSNESIRVVNGRVASFSPLAPGLKRLAFTYALPPAAFPASFLIEAPTGLLEVLLEDPQARVAGAGLVEISPTAIEGRTFRRFQAQDVAAPSVVTVSAPLPPRARRAPNIALTIVVASVMVIALVVAFRRTAPASRSARAIASRESETDALAREIAELDARFDRGTVTDVERAEYEQRRAILKRRLAERLAPPREPR